MATNGSPLYRRSLYDRIIGKYGMLLGINIVVLCSVIGIKQCIAIIRDWINTASARSRLLIESSWSKFMMKLYLFGTFLEYWIWGGSIASKAGRPVQYIRLLRIWNAIRRYFGSTLLYDCPKHLLDTGKPSIIAVSPHGVG